MAFTTRSARLSQHFRLVEKGQKHVINAADAKLFIEAVCHQNNTFSCVEKLVANPNLHKSFHNCLKFDLSKSFLNGPAADLLTYLQEPGLEQLCNGQLLRSLLGAIIDSPTFWSAMVEANSTQSLTENSLTAFAWLLLQLLKTPACTEEIKKVAKDIEGNRSFVDSSYAKVRQIGYKINNYLKSTSTFVNPDATCKPGGRHDNDFEDFRRISILPTPDEILSTELPFYRRMDEIYDAPAESRPGMHYDNQFRLLREDLLGELRNDLHIALGQKQGKRSAIIISGLVFIAFEFKDHRKPCSLAFECRDGLPQLSRLSRNDKEKALAESKNFLRHQSFGCLLNGDDIVAFASIDRDESLLSQDIPILTLQIPDAESLKRVLLCVGAVRSLQYIAVDTAVFAYEPILQQLQKMTFFPFASTILSSVPALQNVDHGSGIFNIIDRIKSSQGGDIQSVLGVSKEISLNISQLNSLSSCLSHAVSLIQGPPGKAFHLSNAESVKLISLGTGKSFIGALAAKALCENTKETILVLCFTNHALDQFLEDLLSIGIPAELMVRLGSKFTDQTKQLCLSEQKRNTSKQFPWSVVCAKRGRLDYLKSELASPRRLISGHVTLLEVLGYLEFSDNLSFYEGLSVPEEDNGMELVGAKNQKIEEDYLLKRWSTGQDAGLFKANLANHDIWSIEYGGRQDLLKQWRSEIVRERIDQASSLFDEYNRLQNEIENIFYYKKHFHIFQEKRIIACTTTGAAKYAAALHSAKPGIVLVEEAGEILESHILTSMTETTKHLILIGDHKQLRPKINNYNLTIEKGDGFDLNRSMFERLVLAGFPITTLTEQHRMRPEISHLIRHLTYSDLIDAEGTKNRPALRGFQDNVIFVNHEYPELQLQGVLDKRDLTAAGSKKNLFEVEMILNCVRYLGQQGYGTDKLVVLTPYLGQLHLLQKELSQSTDPVLNDLDSYDLVQAGLINPASANLKRRPLRISTIDNYQGEESEIVLVSLTRSNRANDIGFMASPERVNVLLSRARNALILIGNAKTFLGGRRGNTGMFMTGFRYGAKDIQRAKSQYGSLKNLKLNALVEDVKRIAPQYLIVVFIPVHKSATNFMTILKWPAMLFLRIPARINTVARAAEEKKRRDADLERKQQARRHAHAEELAEVQRKIDEQQQILNGTAIERKFKTTLDQRLKDLERLKAAVSAARDQESKVNVLPTHSQQPCTTSPLEYATTPTSVQSTTILAEQPSIQPVLSSAREEWDYQKDVEGQTNESLDSLMNMIGLEKVKEKFMSVKARVDAVVRQSASLNDERFNAALLGNPGTGKTTVARLYTKYLCSVGVIPGTAFVETSGSRLASDGISGCKKHIEDICSDGGGALFIDEAYQLASRQNPTGGQVLDFLLAEVENLTGKIVFIIAGYNKNMESFFAHNPGIPSRFPIELQFRDYTDTELQGILSHCISKKYNNTMKLEGGMAGLYARIVSRRIGRGRGREGFGNAREVQNQVSKIADRQAKRLQDQRRLGKQPDDLLLTQEDLIGPKPSNVLKDNAAWLELQNLTGLDSVKDAIRSLLDTIETNYQRELAEKPLVEYSLNKVFVGNPGTGKTTVAKLYGQILADLGFLSSGDVVVKNPSDFVGDVLGASETITKGILASTQGKVLVIDEAYMLNGNSTAHSADLFKLAVVDTLVAQVQSVPGDDRCVLLLGYRAQMEEMFRNSNPGLSRRFPMSSAFEFEDYSDNDLQKIFDLKLNQAGFGVTPETRVVVKECLNRARHRPHFGNAGEIDILIDKAKLVHQKRFSSRQTKSADILEPIDFDPDFDRADRALTNCRQLFKGVVGCEDIICKMEGYQKTVTSMRTLGMNPLEVIPFNFLFRGPPGTGKTSTARRMGTIFYNMGFLATTEVVERSATDLIGQYVGHTGPKTQKLLEKALGKVLFIDEAYRLAEGLFAREAMDELVDCLTKPAYAKRLVVILAGYDKDIDRLMAMNPGLTSRFSETICFTNLAPKESLDLLRQCLKQCPEIDSSGVCTPSKRLDEKLLCLFTKLASFPFWGNARDIETLAKSMIRHVLSNGENKFFITEKIVHDTMCSMISKRREKANAGLRSIPVPQNLQLSLHKEAQDHSTSSVQNLKRKADSSLSSDLVSDLASGIREVRTIIRDDG
ncbi:hypothetical protein LOZ53_003465 [Ophidiomyces ophidiicola]|nr:hypothetical protein LOZ53_003465 [Ophidiomyces ophidiicola]